jgi:Coiled stalk of trimeric autotransporter adhesin
MAVDVQRTLDFGNARKIINLPAGVNSGDAVNVSQLNSAIEGLNFKDSVRVSTQGNVNIAAPGAAIDGVTLTANDRVLVRAQTAGQENGVYIFNGAATPMTRSLDFDSAAEVEQAVTVVEEGTNAGTSYRQTVVNATLNTTPLAWTVFGSGAGAASETSAGIAEIATQAEVDAGTDDLRILTPLKLATSVFATKKFAANYGDGSALSYVITHSLNTKDVRVEVYRNSGINDTVIVEVQRTSVNSVTLFHDTAPAANAYRVLIAT